MLGLLLGISVVVIALGVGVAVVGAWRRSFRPSDGRRPIAPLLVTAVAGLIASGYIVSVLLSPS